MRFIWVLFAVVAAYSQVTDPSGANIPSVTVKARNSRTGVETQTASNAAGGNRIVSSKQELISASSGEFVGDLGFEAGFEVPRNPC